ncbi:MAG: hypothetical protein ACLR23_09200 [Clostridia bacterium]
MFFTAEGIHCGFFPDLVPALQLGVLEEHPLVSDKTVEGDISILRNSPQSADPYIYTAAHQASTTGFPVMRAMSLVYPELEQVDTLLHQYMFGEFLLVGAFCGKSLFLAAAGIDASGLTRASAADSSSSIVVSPLPRRRRAVHRAKGPSFQLGLPGTAWRQAPRRNSF